MAAAGRRGAMALGLAAVLQWPSPAAGDAERPLWELGLGGALLSVPYYRGSGSERVLPLPLVYPVYRGDFLKVDDEGVRGLFLDTGRVRVDVSADGTLPGSDDDIAARRGMPDLDPTFQLGPSLEVDLWRGRAPREQLVLTLPLRGVFALNRSLDHIGLAASPKLTYYRGLALGGRRWTLSVTGGVELGSNELHDYFYEVEPRFATDARPAFDASGGYAGTRFTVGIRGRRGNQWIGAFVRYDNVSAAVFDRSPLVRSRGNFSAGIAVAWFVARSQRSVAVPPGEAPGR